MLKVLNVGSGGKSAALPSWFNGWDVTRLDIDPKVEPDLLMDARDIKTLDDKFDAVYCSHNLEHYTPHDGGVVVRGVRHVLEPHGFVDIHVPDVGTVLQQAGANGWDLDTFLYQSPAGPICIRDVIYGHERQIELAEHSYMLHRNAFSVRTLSLLLGWCGFGFVYASSAGFDLRCVGFTVEPGAAQLASIGLAKE